MTHTGPGKMTQLEAENHVYILREEYNATAEAIRRGNGWAVLCTLGCDPPQILATTALVNRYLHGGRW